MIRDGAPPDWTSLMRDVAKEIADDARDPRPEDPPLPEGSWPWSSIRIEGYEDRRGKWRDGLAEICGATPRAISDALTRLGRAGYEMRQPVAGKDGKPVTDKRGRVVYAAKGHATRFWVPPLLPRPAAQRSHADASNAPESSHPGATYAAQSSHQDATTDPQRSHSGVPKVAPECDPVPSLPPQPSSTPENQSPPPPAIAATAGAEVGPAGAEAESISEGDSRCRYAGCRTPGKPARPGEDYHDPCRHLAEVRARQDQRDGEAAA